MNTDHLPSRRSHRRAVLAGSVLAGSLVLGGGAYAMADTNTPGPSTPAQGGQTQGAQAQNGKRATGDQRQDLGRPMHGETVLDDNGTYTTVRMQQGTVTAKSDGSITIKSADGYTQSYTLTDETQAGGGPGMGGPGMGEGHHRGGRGGGQGQMKGQGGGQQGQAQTTHSLSEIKVGDTVHVFATVKDGTATAVRLGSESWRPAPPAQDGQTAPSQTGSSDTWTPAPTTGTQG